MSDQAPQGYVHRAQYNELLAKIARVHAETERVRADTARIQLQIGELHFMKAIFRQWLTDWLRHHPEAQDDGRRTDDDD
jgi:hypothetical protein